MRTIALLAPLALTGCFFAVIPLPPYKTAAAPPPPKAAAPWPIDMDKCDRPPQHTAETRAAGVTGRVVVEMAFTAAGQPEVPSLVSSSGDTPAHKELDRLTMDAARSCRAPEGFVAGRKVPLAYVW